MSLPLALVAKSYLFGESIHGVAAVLLARLGIPFIGHVLAIMVEDSRRISPSIYPKKR
jgi:hypothetical protein